MIMFETAWVIRGEPGEIGIAYTTVNGNQGMRRLLENDPDKPALLAVMNVADRKKVEDHFHNVLEFRVPGRN